MQMQMQDNGPQGSIIFDTEAQTLSTANHLDCGNFDDMLRKAFEHENIDSSYKANGLIPIYIQPSQIGFVADGYSRTNRRPIEQLRKRIAQPHPDLHFPRSSALERNGRRLRLTGRFFQTDCASCLRIISLLSGSSGSFHFNRLQWNRLNEIFSRMLSLRWPLEGNDDLQAVVKRYAFLVMRTV